MTRPLSAPALVACLSSALASVVGCVGEVAVPDVNVGNPGEGEGEVLPPDVEQPAPQTRFARLTRTEWENTVRDLLRLDARTGFSSELPTDALPAAFLFDNPADSLAVDQSQWAGFQRAAARAAELVASDPTALARIFPASTDDDATRARAFITDLGARAHRRPLSSEEIDEYVVVYETGRDNYEGVDALTAGVRLVIEALLQSPHFLYRVETSSDASGGVIPLDDYEVATRLSFALWQTMPDDTLFDEAAAGALGDQESVIASARRMLQDDRAKEMLDHVMSQLLESEKLERIAPAASAFPDVPADLAGLAREETRMFLAAALDANRGLRDLLLSTTTYANSDLAALYGVEGVTSDELVEIALDPTQRKGLFTQIAFLAQNATSRDPDPIHRGVFLARRMVCLPIAAPPANVPPVPPNDGTQTNRQVVEAHTEQPDSVCASCHSVAINPFGFPFESYDAIGQYRTEDNGQPVNPATSPPLDDGAVPVANALELIDAMAESPQVHDCFAQHWLEATLGRNRAEQDAPLLDRLAADSLAGAGLEDTLASLVGSLAFRARATTELGE